MCSDTIAALYYGLDLMVTWVECIVLMMVGCGKSGIDGGDGGKLFWLTLSSSSLPLSLSKGELSRESVNA
jgi:hypothetical protein